LRSDAALPVEIGTAGFDDLAALQKLLGELSTQEHDFKPDAGKQAACASFSTTPRRRQIFVALQKLVPVPAIHRSLANDY